MPVDCMEFLDILKDFPQDKDWDLSNPIQKLYAAKGYIRYHLKDLQGFKSTTTKSTVRESIAQEASSSSGSKEAVVTLLNSNFAGSGEGQAIKQENPMATQAEQILTLLRSGKLQLERLSMAAQDLRPKLLQMSQADSVYEAKLAEFEKAMTTLNTFLDAVRTFLTQDDPTVIVKDGRLMVDQMQAHCDGVKSMVRRLKALMV